MTWAIVILLIVVGLALSAFFSGSETGIYSVRRVRVHIAAYEGSRRAQRLEKLLRDEAGAIAVILIGNNVANYVVTSAVAFMLSDLISLTRLQSEVCTVAILTPTVFVFGEVVPKNIFHLYADGLMLRGAWLLNAFGTVFRLSGAVWLFTNVARFVARLCAAPYELGSATPKRRVAMLLSDALVAEAWGEEHSDLIHRVISLSETAVHTVMVPQNRVAAISAGADRRELTRIARRASYATLPVFERHRRHVIGQISVDRLLRDHDWKLVGERAQSAVTLTPHRTLAEAITALQEARRDLAVVTDRGGRMLGIVTLSDLLERVVGDSAPAAR